MEELQVIETTSGRQFKPWATKDDVQDPASVTALASEIASGKQAIASAINAKGGTASATESFTELAEDISNAIFDTTTDVVFEEGFTPHNAYDIIINRDKITELNYKANAFLSPQADCLKYISNLKIFRANNVTECNYGYLLQGSTTHIECIEMNKVINFGTSSSYIFYNTSSETLVDLLLPKCEKFYGAYTFGYLKVKQLTLGNLTAIGLTVNNQAYGAKYLRNLKIVGADINLDFSLWTAEFAGAEIGWDTMNTNLYNNLLIKLYDHSQDGQTRTLRIGWLANVTQENIDYATSKGWTLTT